MNLFPLGYSFSVYNPLTWFNYPRRWQEGNVLIHNHCTNKINYIHISYINICDHQSAIIFTQRSLLWQSKTNMFTSVTASWYFNKLYNEVIVQSHTYSLHNVISLLFHFQHHRPTVAFWSLIFLVKDTSPLPTQPPYLTPWMRGGNQSPVPRATEYLVYTDYLV